MTLVTLVTLRTDVVSKGCCEPSQLSQLSQLREHVTVVTATENVHRPLQRKLTEIPDVEIPVTCRVQFLLIGEVHRAVAAGYVGLLHELFRGL